MKITLAPIAACAIYATACASVQPEVRFQGFGDADLERDARVVEAFKTTRAQASSVDDVRVLLDTVPEGIKWSWSDGAFSVEEGFQHRILGKFTLLPGMSPRYWLTWFPEYEEGWRKGLCYWQVPLHWLTLGIWYVIPTNYACEVDDERPKLAWMRDVKVLARASGADMVIVSFLHAKQDHARGAAGLLVRLDPRMKPDGIKTRPIENKQPMKVRMEPRNGSPAASRDLLAHP